MSTRAQRGDRGTRGALAGSTHNKTSNDNTNNNGRRHHQSRGVSRWELDSNVQWGVAESDGAKLAVPEKTALVTKWVKVAKREEKEDAEAEEKKFEAIKRVPYGTKSTTKETTE